MLTFDEMFASATAGMSPYPYQRDIADQGLPDLLQVPTGSGKSSAVVLGWIWRRLYHPEDSVRASTPRRLVIALPMRALVDQFAGDAQSWLQRLHLADHVDLHIAMGGEMQSRHSWLRDMHRDSILVGTTDVLVSKTLNRAYGVSRGTYPLHFALAMNGSHLVIDEVQLAAQSACTLRQVHAFAKELRTAEPSGLTCMSATVLQEALDTVDNPWPGQGSTVALTDEDRGGELGRRLRATKRILRLPLEPGDYRGLAREASVRHEPGTRTLVIVNTVDAAVEIFRTLRKMVDGPEVVLLHSRFRPTDRSAAVVRAVADPNPSGAGVIVVSTQVVEAGVDITAQTLITEAAAWSSIVQRAGRCNRYGESTTATLCWVPPKKPLPYLEGDVEATVAALQALEAKSLSAAELQTLRVSQAPLELNVLRRREFLDLFDTAPDLAGDDIDVSIYIRDADELDASVAWRDFTGRPGFRGGTQLPTRDERCPCPLSQVEALTKDQNRHVWRYDPEEDHWVEVGKQGVRARPGEVLIIAAAQGGYDPLVGLDIRSTSRVPVLAQVGPGNPSIEATSGEATDDPQADEGAVGQLSWLSLEQHLAETHRQASALVRTIAPTLPIESTDTAVEAARLHDVGKAFPPWQAALRGLADVAARPPADVVYAKSPLNGQLRVSQHPGFRHELFGVLMLHERPDLTTLPSRDVPLLRYLVGAHHGRVRVQVRDALDTKMLRRGSETLLGLEEGARHTPASFWGLSFDPFDIDLDEFRLGGERSWSRDALDLCDEFGPFVLAYLEALVRVADWRASAGSPLPEASRS